MFHPLQVIEFPDAAHLFQVLLEIADAEDVFLEVGCRPFGGLGEFEPFTDVIFIEGQGALSHPAYLTSAFILRGSRPDGVVLQHAPGRTQPSDFGELPMPTPATEINLIQTFADTNVLGLTINHENMPDADVHAATDRLMAAGLVDSVEDEQTCCYAKQNKVWAIDPQGMRWEVYRVIEDAEQFGTGGEFEESTATPVTCCG